MPVVCRQMSLLQAELSHCPVLGSLEQHGVWSCSADLQFLDSGE